MALIRDITTMDDGRRITYYYGAPAETGQTAGKPVVSETDGQNEQ